MNSTKARKSHRKLGSTSNKSQKSPSHGLETSKQRMMVISKNNKELSSVLQDTHYDLANKDRLLSNMMFARMKVLEMHSNMKSFMKDFDQVLLLLNTDYTKWPELGCSMHDDNDCSTTRRKMNRIKLMAEGTLDSPQRTNNTDINGTAEESQLKNLPNDDAEKITRKRKQSASNNSVLRPVLKRFKNSSLDEQSEQESNIQNVRNFKKKTLWSKREEKSSGVSSAIVSQNEEQRSAATSVTSARRQKRLVSVESVFQDKIKNATSKNRSTSRRGRRYNQRAMDADDASQDETSLNQLNLSEMEDLQIEKGSSEQNFKNSFEKSKRKQSLQNKGKEKDSQKEFSTEESKNEESKFAPNFVKSIRRQKNGIKEKSTADKSQNVETVAENPTAVKRTKRFSQVGSKKVLNRNNGTSGRGRNTQRAIRAEDSSQDGTLISGKKAFLTELSIVCCDILTDPTYEFDPFVLKFKMDNILNCDSPRDDECFAKGETSEILDEVDKKQESSKNPESGNENPDIEGTNNSSKQTLSTFCEPVLCDSTESKTEVSRNSDISRTEQALIIDVSPNESKLSVSEKEGVCPTTDMYSAISDSTCAGQEGKPEKKCHGDEADLNGDGGGEAESNVVEAKATGVDSKDEREFIDNESECSMVKENADNQGSADNPAGNHSISSTDKDSLVRRILDPVCGKDGPATPPGSPPDSKMKLDNLME